MSSSEDRSILAIVTCGNHLEVALETSDRPMITVVRLAGGGARRSSLAVAAIDLAVEDAGIARADLGSIVVTRGPGSFTGIRAGLATAMGLAAGTGAHVTAYSSLLTQAARVDGPGSIWAAQPGRRGEVYVQQFEIEPGRVPRAVGAIRIMAVQETPNVGPWIGSASTVLAEGVERAVVAREACEALIEIVQAGEESDALEPLYVEGPPVHKAKV